MEPEEKKAVALLQQIQALRKDKLSRRDAKKKEQQTQYKEKVSRTESAKLDARKDDRRGQLRLASIKSKRDSENDGGRARKRKRSA
jgi:ribosome biogenesis protein BMS1